MEPTILEGKVFQLLGCVYYGNPFHSAKEWSYENEIGKLWNRFMSLVGKKYNKIIEKLSVNASYYYELHLEPEEFQTTRNYFVMTAIEIKRIDEIPLEMFVKILPKSNYVLFTTKISEKIELGSYMYKKWIPENNYEQSFPFILEGYDSQRYKGLDDPNSEIDWYIPIKKINRRGF